MAKLSAVQRAFIHENPFPAVLTTLRADGSPHSTVIWVDEQDGDVVFNTARGRTKERNLARDPRGSIVVVDPADSYRWIAVNGRVELTTEGADAQIDALSRKYTGTDYANRREGEIRVSARLFPERIEAIGLPA
jgi:PPOX class probable F420-dependent enzyme